MKKSKKVAVAFLSSFAAAFMSSCNDSSDWVEAKRCVNPENVVVEDQWCEDQTRRASGAGFYRYYYGGRGYYPGDLVSGGGQVPQNGVKYENPSRIARGGFGSTGKAFVSRGSWTGG
jgi:hypothetical protein